MKQKILVTLTIFLVVLAIWQVFFVSGDNSNVLTSEKNDTEKIVINNEEETVENKEDETSNESLGSSLETREIMLTDGVKHSVPLEDIVGGGPPQDGIPPIDNPKFISNSEASDWLKDDEPGIAFSLGDTNRFYPYQILVWHEIVNDTINNERVLVTYCPLCLSGVVFDPLVKGERVEFGISGKLWKSNLVMYDRKTETLWSQILGEAILGELTNSKLNILPSDQILFGNWKKQFPDGEVLSRDTGATRTYGSNPYGSYFSVASFSLNLSKANDNRLANETFIFGVVENGKAKAYSVDAVKQKGIVEDTFEGTDFILRYDKELDLVRMYKKLADETEERINPLSNFWFSWAAAYPETELYK